MRRSKMLEEYKTKLTKQWYAWILIMIMTRLGDNGSLDKLIVAIISIFLIVNVVRYYRLSSMKETNKL